MSTLTLHDVPDELHVWLKQQADIHHRSVNKEAIVVLENARKLPLSPPAKSPPPAKPGVAEILAIGREYAALPVLDDRSADEKPVDVLNPPYPIGQTDLPSLLATGRVQWNGKRPHIDPHRPVATLRGGSIADTVLEDRE